jgi:hypothetical protein
MITIPELPMDGGIDIDITPDPEPEVEADTNEVVPFMV